MTIYQANGVFFSVYYNSDVSLCDGICCVRVPTIGRSV